MTRKTAWTIFFSYMVCNVLVAWLDDSVWSTLSFMWVSGLFCTITFAVFATADKENQDGTDQPS